MRNRIHVCFAARGRPGPAIPSPVRAARCGGSRARFVVDNDNWGCGVLEDTVHRRSGPPAGRWLNSWQHRTDNLHDLLFWRIRAKPHVRTRKDDCSFLTDTGVRTHTRKQNRPAQAPSLARSAHKFDRARSARWARSLGSDRALARSLGSLARLAIPSPVRASERADLYV